MGESIQSRATQNARRTCIVPRCSKPCKRGQVSPYCHSHAKRYAKFGDPRQDRFVKKRAAQFHGMAVRFMRQHGSDEPVLAALVTMQAMLDIANEPEPDSRLPKQRALIGSSQRGPKNPEWLVWREFKRLRRPRPKTSRKGVPLGSHGGPTGESVVIPQEPVSAEEALTAALSVWCAYEMAGDRFFVNDGAPLSYALADAVLKLRLLNTNGHGISPIAASTKRTVGQRIRDELGVFFMRAVETIREEEEAIKARKAVMRQSIEPKVRLTKFEREQWEKLNEPSPIPQPQPPQETTIDEPQRRDLTAQLRAMASDRRAQVQKLLARTRGEEPR